MKADYIFGKQAYPEPLSQEMKFTTAYLSKLDSREAAATEAYRIITTRFEGNKLATITKISDLFSNGAQDLWNRTGFMHCTNQNYLLALLLISSGKFIDDDIERRWTNVWVFAPHQYLIVKVDETKYLEMDPWAAKYGIPLGDHVHAWHTGNRRKKDLSNLEI
jgi:hypothetical protein